MPSRELCEACPWILRHPKLLEKLNAADIVTPVVVNSVRNDVVRKHAENQTTKYVERLRNLRSLGDKNRVGTSGEPVGFGRRVHRFEPPREGAEGFLPARASQKRDRGHGAFR
jgi:hypothetical protein